MLAVALVPALLYGGAIGCQAVPWEHNAIESFNLKVRRGAYCSTNRSTPYSFLARSIKSFMMELASGTGGEMRYTAAIGEGLVAVMNGFDHVVRSSQSNFTIGWTVAAVAEDADLEATR